MDDLIKEVKEALAKVPPAPWEVWDDDGRIGVMASPEGPNICNVGKFGWGVMPEASFIAKSPTWLHQLTERLEAAERQRDEAVKALENLNKVAADDYFIKQVMGVDTFIKAVREGSWDALKRIKGENG